MLHAEPVSVETALVQIRGNFFALSADDVSIRAREPGSMSSFARERWETVFLPGVPKDSAAEAGNSILPPEQAPRAGEPAKAARRNPGSLKERK